MALLWALKRDQRAAVAPTVALALTALIGVGGLAFDYAHMAALDTELQNAADQAALAAATQLDGGTNAVNRATAAANSLLRNTAMFADQTGGPTGDLSRLTATVLFYSSYDEGADTATGLTTVDASAKVAIVTIGGRKASFALTPIIKVFDSGNLSAQAVASLSSSVCKIPPLMICGPSSDYPSTSDIGKGILLEAGGGGSWVPGNYGYLDAGGGASAVKAALARNNDAASCLDNTSGTMTEPGNMTSVTSYLNTRLDLYSASTPRCVVANGDSCPAQNTTKDLGLLETVDVTVASTAPVPANPGWGAPGAKRDRGVNSVDSAGQILGLKPSGFTRDTCHIDGSCTSRFGNGTWDRTTYLVSAHPGISAATIATAVGNGKTATTLTRWDIYKWELADKANRLAPQTYDITASPVPSNTKNGNTTYTFTNRRSAPQPITGTGVAASLTQKDRRLLPVAVVDCSGETGRFAAKVLRFADMFLVEPSLTRTTPSSAYATSQDQIYVELVSIATKPNGDSAFQYYLRQRARLLK